jgi:hypothetical protein
LTCHNEKLRTAQLILAKDKVDVENVSAGAEVWEKVLRKLRAGEMPPIGLPRPDQATYDSIITYLETELDRAAAANPNPGRKSSMHRLNRLEYTNAIRDLLALEIDGKLLLPADDMGYGFDNIAAVLSVSSTRMERYLSAAEKISRLAIGDPSMGPTSQEYKPAQDLSQEERVSEDLPLGSRGGMAIRHYFPLDGEYVIKLLMRRDRAGSILGIARPQQINVYLDDARIKQFTIGGEMSKSELTGRRDFQYSQTADEKLEVRVPVQAGMRLVGISFLTETTRKGEGLRPPARREVSSIQNIFTDRVSRGLGLVTIDGPYHVKGSGDTPSRRKLFVCRPSSSRDEEACAQKILSNLARRAYRRPVTDGDVQRLLGLYKAGRSEGGFEAGIGMALQGILTSPNFLFRIERNPAEVAPGTAYRISDLELASRLSFFLWSSIPDHELLDLAERGKLSDPAVLEQQVRRMLRDPRSQALARNFFGQWLYLRNLGSKKPAERTFPRFNANLREAFQQEMDLFSESIVREDRSVLDLLNANYTFLNERLARHYRISGVYGNYFRRVTLNDENRWGLLGKAAVLMVTSYNSRTAPTLRGKWLLENILGTPPPPPPPNVPSLKEDKEVQQLTMRRRMELHRTNPVCASCHVRMDPLGFALENFDAIGGWRTVSLDNTPIDVSGVMPDGTKFVGPAGLRKVLLNRSAQFVGTLTEKLFIYALGRGVEYYDEPALRKIVREAAPNDYRWSSIMMGIVKSVPFQMRRSREGL